MRLFARTFKISPRTRILDVGGSASIWELLPVQPRLTILNFPSALGPNVRSVAWIAGDGCMLPFKDKSFDIVFSNSVIEHVGDYGRQKDFAEEIARVGRSYWVQTPNRKFPVELHLMLPFVHYLPKSWQRRIITRFTVWQLLVKPSEEQRAYYVDHFLNEIRLLDRSRLTSLFPDARILSERVLGLTKSLVAVRVS